MHEKPKTDKLKGGRKLSNSPSNQQHVEALAKRIEEDPSFPLLYETAKKMYEKHHPDQDTK